MPNKKYPTRRNSIGSFVTASWCLRKTPRKCCRVSSIRPRKGACLGLACGGISLRTTLWTPYDKVFWSVAFSCRTQGPTFTCTRKWGNLPKKWGGRQSCNGSKTPCFPWLNLTIKTTSNSSCIKLISCPKTKDNPSPRNSWKKYKMASKENKDWTSLVSSIYLGSDQVGQNR